MRRLAILGTITVLGLLGVVNTAFANGFYVAEQSASSMGRGSALVADPQDPSTSWFNPAGLAELDGTFLFYGGLTYIHSATSFEAKDGTKTDAHAGNFYQPNLYLVYKPHKDMAIGLGINAPFALGTEWPKGWAGGELTTKSKLYSLIINPNVAYRITDELSIALGLDVFYGVVDIERDLDFLTQRGGMEFSGSTWSVGGNLGILYRPLKQLALAFTYRSRAHLELDDADVHFYNVPKAFRPEVPDGKLDSSLTTPDLLTFAVCYNPFGTFKVELDFNYNLWSVFEELKFDFENDKPEDVTIKKDWENALQVRVGLQYDFKGLLGGGDLKVRAGYIFDQNPVPDETLDPMLPDSDRHDFSVGVGVDIKGFTADVGYMLVYFTEREVGEENELPGTYNTLIHLVSVGLGYRF